jgi:hypothetical protein
MSVHKTRPQLPTPPTTPPPPNVHKTRPQLPTPPTTPPPPNVHKDVAVSQQAQSNDRAEGDAAAAKSGSSRERKELPFVDRPAAGYNGFLRHLKESSYSMTLHSTTTIISRSSSSCCSCCSCCNCCSGCGCSCCSCGCSGCSGGSSRGSTERWSYFLLSLSLDSHSLVLALTYTPIHGVAAVISSDLAAPSPSRSLPFYLKL